MRAIILAAGLGTRLRPYTNDTPKALVPVLGQPIIERQISFLREIGVDQIVIVTGYLAEKFDYLEAKYGVRTIYNEKYADYNNIYSMYLAREYLQNAYVLEGDVFLTRNILSRDMAQSCYFSGIKADFTNEWILKFDDRGRIHDIVVGDGTDYIMSGVSYWSAPDGLKIRRLLEAAVKTSDFANMFWDSLVKDNLYKFDVMLREIRSDDWFELDTEAELRSVEQLLKAQTT